MDLILKNARLDNRESCDIGITAGRIAAIAPLLEGEGRRWTSTAGSSRPDSLRLTSISTSPVSSTAAFPSAAISPRRSAKPALIDRVLQQRCQQTTKNR